jgi:hypothetical protein
MLEKEKSKLEYMDFLYKNRSLMRLDHAPTMHLVPRPRVAVDGLLWPCGA